MYVWEEDQEIWDAAKEIVGDSLSTYITNHLKNLVAETKADQLGFARVLLRFTENNIPQAKTFFGRWIFPLDKPLVRSYETEYNVATDVYAVAITPKNKFVIFNFWARAYDEAEYPPAFLYGLDDLEDVLQVVPFQTTFCLRL